MQVIKINNPTILKFIKNNAEQVLLDIEAAKVKKLKDAQDNWDKLSRFGKWWDSNWRCGLNSKIGTLEFLRKHIDTLYMEQRLVCEGFLKKYNAGITSFQLTKRECDRLRLTETWERYPKIEVKLYQ